jgi:competence protein ComEA
MRRILSALLVFFLAVGTAMAAIDLNSADEQALVGLKGIGPAKARAILDERKRNGPFKSLDDVHARVKGVGPLTIAQWKKDGSASTLDAAPQPGAAK